MALIVFGKTPCAICKRAVEEGDEIVATTAFLDNRFDRFFPYSDTAFHRQCFLGWPLRRAFIARYNAARQNATGSFNQMGPAGEHVQHHAPPGPRGGGEPHPDEPHPYEPGPDDVALPPESRERRPGIHIAASPSDPLPQGARLIVSAQLSEPPGTLRELLAKTIRVAPIEGVREMIETGGAGLPLRLLTAPPADFERTMERPAPDALYFEVGARGHLGIRLFAGSAAYAIVVPDNCRAAIIRAWVIRR